MHSRFIHAKDSNSSAALGILACLCHNNYLVGKLLLASMTAEERKDLYASSFEDVKTKVTDILRILKENSWKAARLKKNIGRIPKLDRDIEKRDRKVKIEQGDKSPNTH